MPETVAPTLLRLYGTSACHLCEAAYAIIEAVLQNLEPQRRYQLEHVDIAEDEALLAAYGLYIPVLERSDHAAALYWPFDAGATLSFLQDDSR